MRKKNAIKVVAFFVLFLFLFSAASLILMDPTDNFQRVNGFYAEPEESLDAVFVGPSNVHSSWIGPLAWGNYGMAVYGYSTSSQPLSAIKYIIEDAKKTQPDALYIISINGFSLTKPNAQIIHYLADYFPWSLTKHYMIDGLCDEGAFSADERLEFYFPILRYHSRWNALTIGDFDYHLDEVKATRAYPSFLSTYSDGTNRAYEAALRHPLTQEESMNLEQLLQYCKSENINALFVYIPSLYQDLLYIERKNTALDICKKSGFPIVDLTEMIGVDKKRDYFEDMEHTDVHGAIKVTETLADYLIENYDFEDKRGDPAYASWDEAYEKYGEVVAPYVIDIEWEGEKRDSSLAAPGLLKPAVDGMSVEVTWGSTDRVDGYRIYRKASGAAWEQLVTVDAKTTTYTDELENTGTYTYTVIGYREENGVNYWGCFDYNGVEAVVAA